MKLSKHALTMIIAIPCVLASVFHEQIRSAAGTNTLLAGLGLVIVVCLIGAGLQVKYQSKDK